MIRDITCKNFDAIIIGSGGSGLMTAITAHDEGVKNIAILSKVLPTNSHTISAKGGINASLGNVVKDDWRWHAFDTLKGSAFLADEDAVELLCKNANEAILFLEQNGVVFSRDSNHKISQRAYGGQTSEFGKGGIAYRACYSKDNTGQTILHTLHQQALKRNIEFYNDFFVIDLLVKDNKCFGCLAIDLNAGSLEIFEAKTTILATGGYSQIYHNTTSSTICTGDGSALALKAGYYLQDMEFVQFHPTGIYGSGFLITEACRGEGAFLLNKNHQRFMQNYAPEMMELSSRDVIAQSMAQEILIGNGGGVNHDHLYLDLRHLDDDVFKNKLPGVLDLVNKFAKLNPRQDLIPVAPSAHYSMGGVATDINCVVGDGLMAVGEVACHSVHGANRLGCNSLLDLVVFGKIAGIKISEINKQKNSCEFSNLQNQKNFQEIIDEKLCIFYDKFIDKSKKNEPFNKDLSLSQIKLQMQKNNDRTLGVFRNVELMKSGYNFNIELLKQIRRFKISSPNLAWNDELIQYLEIENLLLNSLAVGFCALNRLESRGSHYRSDFPRLNNENFLAHSLCKIINQQNIEMEFSLKPVRHSNKFLNS